MLYIAEILRLCRFHFLNLKIDPFYEKWSKINNKLPCSIISEWRNYNHHLTSECILPAIKCKKNYQCQNVRNWSKTLQYLFLSTIVMCEAIKLPFWLKSIEGEINHYPASFFLCGHYAQDVAKSSLLPAP